MVNGREKISSGVWERMVLGKINMKWHTVEKLGVSIKKV